jgi:hypothetical protein
MAKKPKENSGEEGCAMNENAPKPLTAVSIFWAVFLALWAFAISAGILAGLWWFIAKVVIM